jgi:hypothetical protein
VSHSTLLQTLSSGRLGLLLIRLNRSWDWGHVCRRTMSSTATLVSLNVKSSSSGCGAWTARGSSSIGAIGEMRMSTPASFATRRPSLFDYHLRPNPIDNTTLGLKVVHMTDSGNQNVQWKACSRWHDPVHSLSFAEILRVRWSDAWFADKVVKVIPQLSILASEWTNSVSHMMR